LVQISAVKSAIDVYEFNDPVLEKRFQLLTYELRCPKCQNQNLADSNSELSLDLKQVIYEKLLAGETDQQIIEFMKQRYGEFILFNPELNQSNAFLWAGPFIFLLIVLAAFARWYFNNRESNNG
jgi:cytochrome c-type biogenesis protein CcmH